MDNSTDFEFLCQRTVAAEVSCIGVSLHSGDMVNMVIRPAAAGTGIVFVRKDIENGRNVVHRTGASTQCFCNVDIVVGRGNGGRVDCVRDGT